MSRIALILASTCLASAAWAQTPAQTPPHLRTKPVAELEQMCAKQTKPELCHRVAEHARSRYGANVTAYQWQSATGVINNKLKQGK